MITILLFLVVLVLYMFSKGSLLVVLHDVVFFNQWGVQDCLVIPVLFKTPF